MGMMPRQKHPDGFSLIEALVVIAAMALLAVLSYGAYKSFNDHEALGKDAVKVVALYEEARSLSVGSKDGSAYGVHVESAQAVGFKGAVYSDGNANNVVEALNPRVTISDISLSGGGSDVVFSGTGGTTTKSGTVTLSLVADPSATQVITIYTSGLVEITN